MKLNGEKEVSEGKKISFADTDEWGKTSTGISFYTDLQNNVNGVELYTIKYGVVRWNYNDGVTYSQAWETGKERTGIGMNSHLSAHLISDKNAMQDIFEDVLTVIMQKLSGESPKSPVSHYLRQALQIILIEKKGFRLENSRFKLS